MPKSIIILLTLAVAVTFVVVALPIVPLGITTTQPDGSSVVEWVWSRHSSFADTTDFLLRTLWPAFAAFCLILVARMGVRRIHNPASNSSFAMYSLLLIASAHWMLAIQQSAASPHKELKPLWVLYDPAASGYFFEAVFDMEDTGKFLQTYEAKMDEGDVLHVGTHPPGMFLLAKGCIEVCRVSPSIKSLVEVLTPASSIEAFRYVEQNARLQRALTSHELAGLQLLSLTTFFVAVLALVPLSFLAKQMFGPTAAWMTCCMWPTIPAISVFFPKSDVIFPSLSLLLLLLATIGAQSKRNAITIGSVAGLILLLASCLSLAILPTLAAIGFFLVLQALKAPKQNGPAALTLTGTVIGTLLVSLIAIDTAFECNLVAVFQKNLANHSDFYQQFQRTYWKWMLVNPVELSFAVGLPLMGFAVASTVGLFSKQRTTVTQNDPLSADAQISCRKQIAHSMMAAMVGTCVLLWLSGKNNGEAARLWCFMTPWLLLLSAESMQRLLKPLSVAQANKGFTWLLVAQLLVCLITVSRVSGFSF